MPASRPSTRTWRWSTPCLLPERLSGREELSTNPLARLFISSTIGACASGPGTCSIPVGEDSLNFNVSVKACRADSASALPSRALLGGRRIVILDEPTAALGVRETARCGSHPRLAQA